MRTQEENEKIEYDHLELLSMSTPYLSSPYKSLGNVLNWMYVYANLNIAERIQVGERVTLGGQHVCNIIWNDEKQMPIFENFNPEYEWINRKQQIFLKYHNQDNLK